jgi:hypothetical protein
VRLEKRRSACNPTKVVAVYLRHNRSDKPRQEDFMFTFR